MKIKKHGIMALALCLGAVTLTSAVIITACQKDNREKIDLSGIHTTAAPVESMAPETSPAAVTDAATTQAATAAATTAAGKPAASAVKNISTKLNTYTAGQISIEYPSVTNFDDTDKAAAIDALIKKNALAIIDTYPVDTALDTLSVKCKVLSADRNRITITYTGVLTAAGAPYPVNIFYSNTVDVNKADNIGFRRLVDPYTMAGYVLSGDCEFAQVSPELTAELMKVKNETTIEQYTEWFTKADFPVGDIFPESFSYEQEATIFFSIPVPHALGDYAIVKYTPDTK